MDYIFYKSSFWEHGNEKKKLFYIKKVEKKYSSVGTHSRIAIDFKIAGT